MKTRTVLGLLALALLFLQGCSSNSATVKNNSWQSGSTVVVDYTCAGAGCAPASFSQTSQLGVGNGGRYKNGGNIQPTSDLVRQLREASKITREARSFVYGIKDIGRALEGSRNSNSWFSKW